MQRLIFASLSALLITVASATLTTAQTRVEQEIAATQRTTQVSATQLSPADLVALAYQGHYKAQNIPSNGALIEGLERESITAQQLVQAAIALNELPAETLMNQNYLNQVKAQILGWTLS
jgi:hypothetical protein